MIKWCFYIALKDDSDWRHSVSYICTICLIPSDSRIFPHCKYLLCLQVLHPDLEGADNAFPPPRSAPSNLKLLVRARFVHFRFYNLARLHVNFVECVADTHAVDMGVSYWVFRGLKNLFISNSLRVHGLFWGEKIFTLTHSILIRLSGMSLSHFYSGFLVFDRIRRWGRSSCACLHNSSRATGPVCNSFASIPNLWFTFIRWERGADLQLFNVKPYLQSNQAHQPTSD